MQMICICQPAMICFGHMENYCKKHAPLLAKHLKNRGLKITGARLKILDILEHSTKPLTAKDIFKQLRLKADLATLYRNLESLSKLGLINEVKISSKEAYYENPNRHHHHIVCESCGKMADVTNCKILLQNYFLRQSGFSSVNRHSLEFFGQCLACAKK